MGRESGCEFDRERTAIERAADPVDVLEIGGRPDGSDAGAGRAFDEERPRFAWESGARR